MIQRIQSFYLLLTIGALVIITLGTDVFVTTVSKQGQFEIISHGNVYGVQKDLLIKEGLDHDNRNLLKSAIGKADLKDSMKGIPTFYFPFYSIAIILTVLAAATLFSFKNLKRQFKLVISLTVLTLLLFGGSKVMSFLLESHSRTNIVGETVQTKFGLGFYCICIAAAFSFLALRGVKRDLKLIRSIDRIR